MNHRETEQKPGDRATQENNAKLHERPAEVLASSLTIQKAETLRHKTDVLEEILSRGNMFAALRKVEQNKGAPGIDGMTTEGLRAYLKTDWERIKEELQRGTYKPSKVKSVKIPKPNGGERTLGIPTVIDRLIQQAINQVLQSYIDCTFSNNSYGFRPNRSAHQAVKHGKEYIDEGYEYMVDIDIEKFFNTVNQDRLMSALKDRMKDQRVLNLIRKYLNAGNMNEVMTTGMIQGSPLSPLLSNIYLDSLDKELEKRGLRYIRYADDCTVFVKTKRSASRVMENVSHYLEKKLKLKVNASKSKIGKGGSLLGFKLTFKGIYILPEKISSLKEKIRLLTPIRGGRSMTSMIEELTQLLRGWHGYFKIATGQSILKGVDSWTHRRLRACQYKQYKIGKAREKAFRRAGFSRHTSHSCGYASAGAWAMSLCMPMRIMLQKANLAKMGLYCLCR